MSNVLVLGCTGMLGWMVKHVLSMHKQFNVKCSSRLKKQGAFKLDVKNGVDDLQKIFEEMKGFDYIINCAEKYKYKIKQVGSILRDNIIKFSSSEKKNFNIFKDLKKIFGDFKILKILKIVLFF